MYFQMSYSEMYFKMSWSELHFKMSWSERCSTCTEELEVATLFPATVNCTQKARCKCLEHCFQCQAVEWWIKSLPVRSMTYCSCSKTNSIQYNGMRWSCLNFLLVYQNNERQDHLCAILTRHCTVVRIAFFVRIAYYY